MQFPSIADAFISYFDVSLATTVEQREQIARLRYRVYCEEFGYENATDFPGGMEIDEFDDYSLHCLVTHKRSARPGGVSGWYVHPSRNRFLWKNIVLVVLIWVTWRL